MNVVRSRIPIMGIALTAVLIAGASLVAMPLEAQRPTVRKPAVKAPAAVEPIAPCCNITAIDVRAGLVTAKNLETGATFQFRVTDRRLLGSLAVGQKVYADDAGEKAGLTPATPCCDIVAGADKVTPAQPINGVRPAQPVNTVRPAQPVDTALPAGPINGVITQIDIRTGAVTARAAGGAHLQFRVAARARLRALRPGQPVSIDHVASQAQSAGARLDMLSLIWVEAGARAGAPAPPPGSQAACTEQEKQPQNAGKICLMEPNDLGSGTFTWSCECKDKNLVEKEDSDVKKEAKDGGTP